MNKNNLTKIRIACAAISFILMTLLFLDFSGLIHLRFGWIAKIQFIPALLALNIVPIALLLVATLIFGRIYCSVVCPLGIIQDMLSWVSAKFKKNRFSYRPAHQWIRLSVLAAFILAFIAGIGVVVSFLEPYSAFGRIASTLIAPLYRGGNNVLAYLAERINSYAFHSVDIWINGISTLLIAAVTTVAIAVLVWRSGRLYCNSICPVGTVLGFLSKYSLLKPIINKDKCNRCALCSRNCKALCIEPKLQKIDYSRCVVCLNCVEQCTNGAINYGTTRKSRKSEAATHVKQTEIETSTARRTLLSAGLVLGITTGLKAQGVKLDGGYAPIKEKKTPKRATSITPPGSLSMSNFARHCTGCQLCVSSCPNQVLRQSRKLSSLMQPEMLYEHGYCRPECVQCSQVCPTGAIQQITAADKSATQIGHAVWVQKQCIVNTDKVGCGNCARHCPAGAIQMVPADGNDPKSLKIPVIDTERCIGCGACENLCPSRPYSAIYVEGHERHRTV